MFFDSNEDNSVSYWPSVSDLFMALFIIGLVLVALTQYILTDHSKIPLDESVVKACGADMKNIREPVNRMRVALPVRPPLRDTQSAKEVVEGLNITSKDVVEALQEANARNIETQQIVKSINLMRKSLGKVVLEEGASPKDTVLSLEETARDVVDELEKLKVLKKELNDKPPILVVDATQVSFEKGKAELLPHNANKLRNNVFTKLIDIVERYKSVDTIEIIGHTDSSPVGSNSNIDSELLKALKGHAISMLSAGSNADLGLMRAIAVKQDWDDWRQNRLPREIQVRCYSAAQGIDPSAVNGKINEDQARRIEIRFTQLR